MYNRYICECCGAHLDPNEDCECQVVRKRNKKIRKKHYNNIFEYMKELEDIQNERIAV